jgi:hypothetical protein
MPRLVGTLGERIAVTARRQTRLIRGRHRGKHPSCDEERHRNDEKCDDLPQARSTPPSMILWKVPDHRSHGSHPSRQDARCSLVITMAHDDRLRTEIDELTAYTWPAWRFQQSDHPDDRPMDAASRTAHSTFAPPDGPSRTATGHSMSQGPPRASFIDGLTAPVCVRIHRDPGWPSI